VGEVARDRREGRGRLSTLDMLPETAEPDMVWALEALNERSMPQNAILTELNARLADRGIAGVSKSAFNRWSIRKALQFRRLNEIREIAAELNRSLGTSDTDEVTIAIGELTKGVIYERLENADELGTKNIRELSASLKDVVNAQRASADHRRKLEERVNAQVETIADRTEEVLREKGLGAETVAQIRRDVLGLRQ
jgi:hypothetical protein